MTEKRHAVQISAVPSGQHRSMVKGEKEHFNGCGVFALMNDGTIEVCPMDTLKWSRLPEIPERKGS